MIAKLRLKNARKKWHVAGNDSCIKKKIGGELYREGDREGGREDHQQNVLGEKILN